MDYPIQLSKPHPLPIFKPHLLSKRKYLLYRKRRAAKQKIKATSSRKIGLYPNFSRLELIFSRFLRVFPVDNTHKGVATLDQEEEEESHVNSLC